MINILGNNNEHYSTIDSLDFVGGRGGRNSTRLALDVPLELLRGFAGDDGEVTVTSSVFMNVRALFPDGLPNRNE